jgi:D-amino-acid dehydrogenase
MSLIPRRFKKYFSARDDLCHADDASSMKVVIIGAGLIGITSAYFLNQRGHHVVVLDRQAGPGRETSFANGSLLTPSMPEPWNTPGSWRVLLKSIGRSDAPLQLRLSVLPTHLLWGMKFLNNARPEAFERNTLANLALALYSLEVMASLRRDTFIEYARRTPGTLKLFRNPVALDAAALWSERLASHGPRSRRLSPADIVTLEPALAPIEKDLAGAIRYEGDETGDARRFCVALATQAQNQGVEFRYSTEVSWIETRAGKVEAVFAGTERIAADRYVVAAASYSAPILKEAGVRIPVRPAKGYSVTFDQRSDSQSALRIPIVDDDLHAVIVPLGDKLRAAGTAEFAGYDLKVSNKRVENLARLVKRILPRGPYDLATARAWCGLRAMSADGVPLIGATSIPNLYLNTGHGHLGWTLAAGSAQLITDIICATAPAIDTRAYQPGRFR